MKAVKVFRFVVTNFVIVVFIGLLLYFGFSSKSISVSGENSPIYKGSASDKVSLMINVYWGTEYLDEMLKCLSDNEVKTTFFVGGSWVRDNEEAFMKIVDAGHEIGNHGFFHKDHSKISYDNSIEEISATHNLVKSLCGKEMTLFAPPSGAYNKNALLAASKLGYASIMWSKDTIDWRDQDERIIIKRATKNISGGDLILMHPTAATAKSLNEIILKIKEANLCVSPVSEVIYPVKA